MVCRGMSARRIQEKEVLRQGSAKSTKADTRDGGRPTDADAEDVRLKGSLERRGREGERRKEKAVWHVVACVCGGARAKARR